jgi:restriction endonuclease S subunit
MPRLAVVVVLPTPPLPEQIRIVRVVDTGIPLCFDQDKLQIRRDNSD